MNLKSKQPKPEAVERSRAGEPLELSADQISQIARN
jgi:hypothetical protein